MRVVEIPTFGPPEVLRLADHPTPAPQAGEVLIRVAAAALNRADLLQRRGLYPPPEGASSIPGLEVAGEIIAVGQGVERWKSGDKVCALLTGGGYAEYVAAPAGQCLPVPPHLSLVEAAALPEAVFTTWANLFESGQLKPSESVLIHGGSGGIGSVAIQMAKAHGARVFATAGGAEKVKACRDLGADEAIDYRTQDFVEILRAATQGRGVDVVLDILGGDNVNRNLDILAPQGRHISIGTLQNKIATLDLRTIMAKQLTLTGSTLRNRPMAEKAHLAREIEVKAWPWVLQGSVKPVLFKIFPFAEVVLAHKMMESGAHFGKIILEVSA